MLRLSGLRAQVRRGNGVSLENLSRGTTVQARHALSGRLVEILLQGGLINWVKERLSGRQ